MLGRLDHTVGELSLRCEGCCGEQDAAVTRSWLHGMFDGVAGYRAALNRATRFLHEYNWNALGQRETCCLACGRTTTIQLTNPDGWSRLWPRGEPGIFTRCEECGAVNRSPLRLMVLGLPELQRFWRDHPRLQLLPIRDVQRDGKPALLLGVESVTGDAGVDVLCAPDNYEVLDIHRRLR